MLGSYISSGSRFSREELDVTDINQVEKILRTDKPDVVIHLAAITDMKKCEDNPDLARSINEIGTYNIAKIAKEIGAKVIYVSTNAVFDGEKVGSYISVDLPHPVNVYGHSKYMGELAVLGMDSKNLVIRTSWIFGGGKNKDKKFVGKIMPKLIANETFSAVDDVKGTPTYAKDLAVMLQKLATSDTSGVIHITNSGSASRYDMAMVIKETIKSKSQINSALLSSFGLTGNTLKNEVLDSGLYVLRPWQEALKEYIRIEWK